MKFTYSTSLVYSLLILSACSSGGGGGASTGPSASDAGIKTGTYSTVCTDQGGGLYYVYKADVGANSLKFTTTLYGDSACAVAGVLKVATHTLTFPGAATTPTDAQKIDVTAGSVTMTGLTDYAISQLNSGSECNRANWVKNVAQNVTTDTDCGNGTVTKIYSIIKTTSTTLSIGTADVTNDGLTEAKRHQNYNVLVYTKQ